MGASTYTPPTITVEHRPDGRFYLMASSYGQLMPAGERLLRGYPHPVIAFSHDTREAADKDAAVLRTYLAECASGKRKDTKPVGKGWWE